MSAKMQETFARRLGDARETSGRRRAASEAGRHVHLARVIGAVWSTQKVESLKGQRLLVIQPLTHELEKKGRPLVAVDTVSAAPGQLVYFVKSREAAKALADQFNPSDASILGIVDELRVTGGKRPGRTEE